MRRTLWVDMESRSRCDLKTRGVYNYALDESTGILCIAYAFDDDDVKIWTPADGDRALHDVLGHTGQIRAHNAAFERLMFRDVLRSRHKLEQFYCTATQARANCAPGALEDIGRFAGASMRKDHRGAHLIRKLCVPQENGEFLEDPALMAELLAYCAQDVRAMREISKGLRELSDEEISDYHTNERVNDRGVLLDKPLAEAATRYAAEETAEIVSSVRQITGGAVTSPRSPKARDWVWDSVGEEARKLMIVHKDGEAKKSIDKTVRANMLALAEENPDEISSDVAEVLQCIDDVWSSSVAKFKRAASLADVEDHRVRGAFVFAGGAATGRASSYGLQVHNYPRKTAHDPAAVRRTMCGNGGPISPEYGPSVNAVLKSMLRPSLIAAPGHELVICDWSSIEARVNPWASGRGEAKLDLFRGGADIYVHNAVAAFGGLAENVTPDQRQIGKVMELASGFAGSVGAFAAMGRVYNVRLPEHDARRMVNAWRAANRWAVMYWDDLEHAYTGAMRSKGCDMRAGKVVYHFDGKHLWWMLPSGRVLCYPNARLEAGELTYSKASWKPAADATEWPRGRLWKGLACENIAQAIANDVLRHSLRELEQLGVVLHVHDEIVCETRDSSAVADTMRRVMTTPPPWAAGLPLAIGKPVISTRYGK